MALPYVTASGNVEKALLGIKAAATPDTVSQDFVKTILKIPGGSGNQMAAYLKKIGYVKPDTTPSDIYTRFRNPASSVSAVTEALKIGYAPLAARNEYWYALDDTKLRGLIIEETGLGDEDPIVTMVLGCIKGLKKFADLSKSVEMIAPKHDANQKAPSPPLPPSSQKSQSVGLNLGYTINLNLPATTDIAVFNAIFKSLKEHLLEAPHADG